MKVYLILETGYVRVRGRVVSGDKVGEIDLRVHPGEAFEGYSYEELRAKGNGPLEIKGG